MKNIIMNRISNYADIQNSITKKLVNKANNPDAYGVEVGEPFDEMILTFLIDLENVDNNYSDDFVRISKDLTDTWGVNLETVAKDAIEEKPILVSLMGASKCLYEGKELSDLPDFLETDGEPKMAYMLTNKTGILGASVITNNGILERIREKVGGGYWLIPSSIHEWIVIPDKEKRAEDLINMIESVNAIVADDEILGTKPIYIK